MTHQYFSDREQGPRARTEEAILPIVWGGIAATIESLVADGSFGESFPDTCSDGDAVVGTDWRRWYRVMRAEVADIEWPFSASEVPTTLKILDLVEFCHLHVSKGRRAICITYKPQRWHKGEPGEHARQETSSRFEQLVLRAASEGMVNQTKGAALPNEPLADFRERLAAVEWKSLSRTHPS